MRKIIFSLLLSGSILLPIQINNLHISQAVAADEVDPDYITDVPEKHWASPAVEYIVRALGIMEPKTPGKFAGNDISTRYEVAKAFYNAAKKLEMISGLELKVKTGRKPVTFTDVDEENKMTVESIVNEYYLMQGYPGNKFMGNVRTSRYELAFELNNYLNLLEQTVATAKNPSVNLAERFKDIKDSHWATSAVKNIVNKYQIMKGYPDQTFKGDNTLTRYELASVLKKFIDYIDKYLIPIPKYIPSPIKTVEPTPVPTAVPTVIPTPVPVMPTATPIPKTPIYMYEIKGGLDVKVSSTGTDTDTLIGPAFQGTAWFPKLGDARFGLSLDGYFLGYGKSLMEFHKVNNLRRSSFGIELDWRALGADYLEDTSLIVGIGYQTLQWVGATYSYSNGGPKARAVLEVPVSDLFSILVDEQFHYAAFTADGFSNDLIWRNELFVGAVIPAYSSFSVQFGYRDSRHSLAGKSEIFGDIGGTVMARFRF